MDTVLSTFEGGSAAMKLVNPKGLVPASGRVISLPSRKPGKEPPWMISPQRLVEFTDNLAVARWPRTALDNLVDIDFDPRGQGLGHLPPLGPPPEHPAEGSARRRERPSACATG